MNYIKKYQSDGLHLVPLKPKSKIPLFKDWQKESYADKWHEDWNIGIALGDNSNGLVDVDLDWQEACEIAGLIFGKDQTAAFGRQSKRYSHYLVYSPLEKHKKFILPQSFKKKNIPDEHGLCVLELRTNGNQTMFPPSIHPNGERIEWENTQEPRELPANKLVRGAGMIAFFAVCAHLWPEEGSRQDAALAFAGICKWAGIPENICHYFVKYVSAGDSEQKSRLRAVKDTYASDKVTSKWTKFLEVFDFPKDAKKTFNEWLGLAKTRKTTQKHDFNSYEEKYFVIRDGSKVRIGIQDTDELYGRKIWHLLTKSDFLLLDSDPAAQAWLKSPKRKTYDGFTFSITDEKIVNNKINQWQGWHITPQTGDYSLILSHIHNVIAAGNDNDAEYIIKWMAWSYQNPDKPAEVALVFRGGKGTGKSVFASAFVKSAGQHGMHISSPNLMTGRFNAHLSDCIFLFADEAFWAGDKSGEGALKRMITEKTLTIEAKYRDAHETLNRLHIIIASNEDWIIPATENERRYAVFDVSNKHQQDHEYFRKLVDQINNQGWAAFMHYLLNLDLKGWHPRHNVPQTKALQSQIHLSENPIKVAMRQCLETGTLPHTHESFDDAAVLLFPHFLDFVRQQAHGKNITQARIGRFLGEIPNVEKFDGKSFKYTNDAGDNIYERCTCYRLPPLKQVRSWFDPAMEWDNKQNWAHAILVGGSKAIPLNEDNPPF